MKYFVLSNIHSYYYKLKEGLEKSGFDVLNPEHKIVICGDLFDKGPNPKELQSFIVELLEKDKIILY